MPRPRTASLGPMVLGLVLALATLLTGCKGSSTTSSAPPPAQSSTQSSTGASAATGAGGSAGAVVRGSSSPSPAATACPTQNTRSFAKTRFVGDVGGAAFLIRRYLYQPYRQGKFVKGASGRRIALVKAAAAAAASAKLLKNASENAKANPTLCRTIAAPLSHLTDAVSSLTHGGSFDPGTLAGLDGGISNLLGAASSAGIAVKEQPRSL